MAIKKANPSWIDVKAKLADFDRFSLFGLVQDLYAASKDHQTASGRADGLGVESMVFYYEQAAGLRADVALDDEGHSSALVRMFGQALKAILALPPEQRGALPARLDAVRSACDGMGYGVVDDMDAFLAEHGADD